MRILNLIYAILATFLGRSWHLRDVRIPAQEAPHAEEVDDRLEQHARRAAGVPPWKRRRHGGPAPRPPAAPEPAPLQRGDVVARRRRREGGRRLAAPARRRPRHQSASTDYDATAGRDPGAREVGQRRAHAARLRRDDHDLLRTHVVDEVVAHRLDEKGICQIVYRVKPYDPGLILTLISSYFIIFICFSI